MAKDVKFQKRPTRKLKEVVDSDLLTATERIIMGSLGGFYCMADEQAYFRVAGEKASMSLTEFERKLKKELHPNFFVAYNPTITSPDKVQGHQIGFYVPEYQGFVPLCKVGKSGSRDIPANSQGKMVKQKMDARGETEVAVIFRGYVAAFEAAKAFINDAQLEGIKPSRCISAKEFFIYKRVAQEIGGETRLHQAFAEGRKLADEHAKALKEEEAKKQDEATKNVEKFLEDVVKEQKAETTIEVNPDPKEVNENGSI